MTEMLKKIAYFVTGLVLLILQKIHVVFLLLYTERSAFCRESTGRQIVHEWPDTEGHTSHCTVSDRVPFCLSH